MGIDPRSDELGGSATTGRSSNERGLGDGATGSVTSSDEDRDAMDGSMNDIDGSTESSMKDADSSDDTSMSELDGDSGELGDDDSAERGRKITYPTFWQHSRYRGYRFAVNTNLPDVRRAKAGVSKNNDLSSLIVPRGWEVWAYTKRNYKGTAKRFVGPTKISFLGRYGRGGRRTWNDCISSIKVRQAKIRRGSHFERVMKHRVASAKKERLAKYKARIEKKNKDVRKRRQAV